MKQYERAKEKPICLCTVVCISLCTSGGETSKQVNLCTVSQRLKAEKKYIMQSEIENRNKEKVSKGIHEHTHTPSPPVAFLPRVFVNHPFRSVSLWVGPLPFNASTFVARDSAAIQILCRRLTPQCVSHKPHLIRGT